MVPFSADVFTHTDRRRDCALIPRSASSLCHPSSFSLPVSLLGERAFPPPLLSSHLYPHLGGSDGEVRRRRRKEERRRRSFFSADRRDVGLLFSLLGSFSCRTRHCVHSPMFVPFLSDDGPSDGALVLSWFFSPIGRSARTAALDVEARRTCDASRRVRRSLRRWRILVSLRCHQVR